VLAHVQGLRRLDLQLGSANVDRFEEYNIESVIEGVCMAGIELTYRYRSPALWR
jgi:hypothetical protein